MTHDIFISYSSAQSDAAQAVCHLLEQHDIKCWMAPRNLTGGAEQDQRQFDDIKDRLTFAHLPSIDKVCRSLASR